MSDPVMPAFAGFFFALAVIGPAARSSVTSLLTRAPEPLVEERVLEADRMCLRDLRRLPSIGPARSLAIVRARFERDLRGGPEKWSSIDGIGPETVSSARRWIEAARAKGVRGPIGGGARPGAARLSGPPVGAYTSPAADPGSSIR
jgi:hypothetical protein